MREVTFLNLGFRYYPGDLNRVPVYVPYGCLCIISALKSAGYLVDFRDYQFNQYPDPGNIENMADFMKNPADIICISCLAKELPYSVLLCNKLKEKYPGKSVILGGPGPSGVAEKLVREFDSIDFVVIGEGDLTIAELLRAIDDEKDFCDVSGIAFKKDGQVMVTRERERIKEIDNLPFPAYEHINLDSYEEIFFSCSRGCPFKCTFCAQADFWKGKMIQRNFEKIFEELDMLSKGKSHFKLTFSDNIFCNRKEDFRKFYEEYKKKNYTFKFNMCRRLDDVDDEILSMAQEMNCETVLYGVESASRNVLEKIKKNHKANVKEVLVKTANRIETIASFIFNFPFETIYDFLETMNFIFELLLTPTKKHLVIHLHYLAPIPGTEILEEYADRLIYREFGNILTTGRGMENYDYYLLRETKKTLTFPPMFEVKTHPSEIRKLVLTYKDIFASYYIYQSMDMDTKEKFLKCFHKAVYTGITDYFFNHNGYRIFIGRKKFYISSDNEKDNALYITLTLDNLDCIGVTSEGIKGKKLFIVPEISLPVQEEAELKIAEIFRKFIDEKVDYTLMKPVPPNIADLIGLDFKNVISCRDCPSMFSVDDEKITYCGGIKGKPFTFYSSREDIYKEFLERSSEKVRNNCFCPG